MKLISRFSRATKRESTATKKWFESLNAPQRGEATKMMKATLALTETK